ncbi:MAG: Omp28-related outer membrane protein, partial [Bacteroidales bacterium]|nr:Omp28-related outer membrane protein [Bacteroidales bacterium]
MKRLFSIGLGLLWLSGAAAMAQETPTLVSTEAQNRKILIEEFTGIGCGNCPRAHRTSNGIVAAYPEQAFVINIHQGYYAKGQTPDLTTAYGDALYEQSGAEDFGWPAGTINRHVFEGDVMYVIDTKWATTAPKVLDMPSYVNVGAKASIDWATRKLTVDVEIYYTAKPEATTNYINVALLQDFIPGPQSGMAANPAQIMDGQYSHMHALRDFLTGQWGEEITDLAAGKLITRKFEADLPESIKDVALKLEDLSVLVYITESHTEVMNACHAEMTHIGAPSPYVVWMLNAEQLPYLACDAMGKAQLRIANKLCEKEITSLQLEAVSALGTQEIELTTDNFRDGVNVAFELMLPISMNLRDKVTFRLTKVNGEAYTGTEHNEVETTMVRWGGYTASVPVTLDIVQDQFGNEITWTLKKDNDTLQTGGPYRELNNPGTRSNKVVLDTAKVPGCYVLTVYDQNHDGIHKDKGDGYIELKDAAGEVFVQMDGVYTDSVQICFAVTGVANENATAAAYDLSIQPNPVSAVDAELYLTATQAETLSVAVYSLSGVRMGETRHYTVEAGAQRLTLPTAQLSAGLYIVIVNGEDGRR